MAHGLGFGFNYDSTSGKASTFRIVNPAGSRTSVLHWKNDHNLKGVARTKRISERVQTSGPSAWKAWLAGYLDTDGSVRVTPSPTISWHSVNRVLLTGKLRNLLALLGVSARIERSRRSLWRFGPVPVDDL